MTLLLIAGIAYAKDYEVSKGCGTLHILSGDTGVQLRKLTTLVEAGVTPAAADLDGDGAPGLSVLWIGWLSLILGNGSSWRCVWTALLCG